MIFNFLRDPLTWRTDVVAFPDWMPPLFVSPSQVAIVLLVLFLVAASQPRPVVVWVWLITSTLAAVGALPASHGPVIRWGLLSYENWMLAQHGVYLLGAVVLVTAAVVAGQMVRGGTLTRHKLAEVQKRGVVLDERARIARELHDVVAHHISMIAVRAETAPYRLGELPEPASREFAEISQASRESTTPRRPCWVVPEPPRCTPCARLPVLPATRQSSSWVPGRGSCSLAGSSPGRCPGHRRRPLRGHLRHVRGLGASLVLNADRDRVIDEVRSATCGAGCDVVVDLVGSAGTYEQALQMIRPGGQLVLVGYQAGAPPLDAVAVVTKELRLSGSVGATRDEAEETVRLATDGLLTPVVSAVYKLPEAATALSHLAHGDVEGRLVLAPEARCAAVTVDRNTADGGAR